MPTMNPIVLAFVLAIGALTPPARCDESVQFGISVVINDQEVVSTGGATYAAPDLCLDCRHWETIASTVDLRAPRGPWRQIKSIPTPVTSSAADARAEADRPRPFRRRAR